jgi:endonuclease/exonuclease/phosphatase family metal-dependent hydrolase
VQERKKHLILADDFNMAPWSQKFKTFTKTTDFGRFDTYTPTWPVCWQSVPLLPLTSLDNVFVSSHFAKVDARTGPRLDSDHLPVIADIARSE